jgi:Flp pilus assembly pilin Flp
VVHGLAFVFRSLGLSYQEVTIALIGDRAENFDKIRNFAAGIAVAATAGLGIIAFTPLAEIWFRSVVGLSPELAELALLPARIATALPALTVLMAFQRALLVSSRLTRPLTGATVVEVASIAAILSIAIFGLDVMGAVGATSALVLGRLAGNAYLTPPCLMSLRELRAGSP